MAKRPALGWLMFSRAAALAKECFTLVAGLVWWFGPLGVPSAFAFKRYWGSNQHYQSKPPTLGYLNVWVNRCWYPGTSDQLSTVTESLNPVWIVV